jgi:hypothetical protein
MSFFLSIQTFSPNETEGNVGKLVYVAKALGSVVKQSIQARLPSTDTECRWDIKTLKCQPHKSCSLHWKVGDFFDLNRACRLRDDILLNSEAHYDYYDKEVDEEAEEEEVDGHRNKFEGYGHKQQRRKSVFVDNDDRWERGERVNDVKKNKGEWKRGEVDKNGEYFDYDYDDYVDNDDAAQYIEDEKVDSREYERENRRSAEDFDNYDYYGDDDDDDDDEGEGEEEELLMPGTKKGGEENKQNGQEQEVIEEEEKEEEERHYQQHHQQQQVREESKDEGDRRRNKRRNQMHGAADQESVLRREDGSKEHRGTSQKQKQQQHRQQRHRQPSESQTSKVKDHK